MFFSALILVTVNGEHDCLQQRIDFGHGNKSTEVGNMSRLGLQEKQEISVFLCLVVVGKEAFLHVSCIFEVAGNFVLLALGQFSVAIQDLRR